MIILEKHTGVRRFLNLLRGATSPGYSITEMVGGYMKCYTLSSNHVLFPSICVSNVKNSEGNPAWGLEVGTCDKLGVHERLPLPKNTPVVPSPKTPEYGRIMTCPLSSGVYMVMIEDQSREDQSWHISSSSTLMVIGKGWATHGDNYPDFGGPEYIVSMLPGDWIGITVNCDKWSQPKVYVIHAQNDEIRVFDSIESTIGFGTPSIRANLQKLLGNEE